MGPMRGFVLWGVAYTLLGGCVFDPTGGSGGSENDESGDGTVTSAVETEGPTSVATAQPSSSSADPSTSSTSEPTSTSDPSETSDTTPTTTDPTDTDGPPLVGCPDPLPDGWILCQDFEDPTAIDEDFHGFASNNAEGFNHYRFDDEVAFSGSGSLVVEHVQFYPWSGTSWLRFGAGPSQTPHAPNETFEEVWVRLRIMLEDGWDVGGFGDVIEINSVTTNFAHVMSASIDAPDSVLRARARSCVVDDDMVQCDGDMDWVTMQERANAPGPTPFFDGGFSGEWHCIVVHVRLGDPDRDNGLIELHLDGELEAAIEDVDFRGELEGVGLNAIQLSAFWEGGSPRTVRRYFDDLVVSSTALACD